MDPRKLFNIAAAFNLVVGIPMLLAPGLMANVLELQTGSTGLLFMQISALAISGFGIVYALIAHDPVRHRAYILIGAGLKLGVAILVWAYWLQGLIGWPLAALAAGDMIFSVLFALYYRGTAGALSS